MVPTFSERVREAVQAAIDHGHDINGIALACDISNKAVYQWRDGSTQSIKGAPLVELAEMSGYSARWIATGKGKKIALSKEEAEIIRAFRLMGEEMRQNWLSTASSYINRAKDQAKAA